MRKAVTRLTVTLSLLVTVFATTLPGYAALPFFSKDKDELPSLAPMLDETTPAVVSIAVVGSQQSRQRLPDVFRHFFGPNAPREQTQERPFRGLGSGVIIDAEKGYIVTNHHVIDNANEITVTLKDGRELEAKKIGADPQSDIALLQVDSDNLVALELANSDELRVGDFVIAVGNPFGLSQTVTSGIVSALGRSSLNIEGYEDFIQTDAAINRGNSGGALVNLRGELVGINTAIFGPGGGNVGIGFAIPSNMMKNLVDQIIEFGEVRRGLLGISGGDVDAGLAEAMNLSVNRGAFVREVTPDSAADDAGINAGDIIVAINGNDIEGFQELRAKVGSLGAGTQIELSLLRDGKRKTVDVTLGSAEAAVLSAEEIHPGLSGATLTNGTTQQGVSGVVVSDIEDRSPAQRSGLVEGDVIIGVNRNPITSVRELSDYLNEKEGVIALNIKRGKTSLYLVVR
ncbi:DegQ family serine endoprotease [Alteromonadaceae bacterium M269]|nr:DegQ family serine endoprotease [Alteromonadaceae bacterium M269]